MPNYSVFDKTGKKVSDIALSDAIFAITPNASAMHLCVVAYLANQRQGTQSTLTRAEVRGGGKKPWRQKGSGRARQGSIRSPQWTHGGIALGPKPREYGKTVNKKVRRLAMKSALSSKVAAEELIVLDSLEMNEIKTKEVVSVLKALETGKKKNVTGIMALVLIAAIGGIGGFMYMKSNKGKKKADAPDPDADYFDSEDDEDYLADMDIGEESVSDQDTDEDISMEEDIQMDEADEK